MTLSDHDDELPKGTLFGRHSIVRLIAFGGMAGVYEAVHLDLQKRVAIKVMRRALATDPSLVQRFVLEARAAARLRHPNVIAIHDVGVERGRPYMIMELLEGTDLCEAIHAGAPLSIERIADVMLPVVSAVSAAHAEGILHRDLKPENVFLAKERGSRERPVLLDFGISRIVAKPDAPARALTRVGFTVGTPEYMPLEQLRGAQNIDARCDQYALGVTLYESLTQRLPYRVDDLERLAFVVETGAATPPSEHRAGVPPELDAAVLRAMSVDREKRYESVRDLGRALFPFASPVAQAIWAEEFGDAEEIAARLSPPAARNVAAAAVAVAVAPTIPAPPPAVRSTPPPAPIVIGPDALRSFTAFESSSDEVLQELLRVASARRFAEGARILTQGAHGSGCFLLVAGEVQVVKSTSAGQWIVGALRAGSVFGQIALVDHLPRTASVVAASEVEVIQIGRAVFDRLLASTSEVALRLREQIAISGIRQLRHATRRFAAIVDRQSSGPTGTDPRRELVYVQVAAQEWGLSIEDDAD